MAKITFYKHLDHQPADYLNLADPGVVDQATPTLFSLHSLDGATVRVTGSGFTYDIDGTPIEGTIAKIEIRDAGNALLWRITDIAPAVADLSDLYLNLFGWDSGGGHVPGSGFRTMTALLSGGDNVFKASSEGNELNSSGYSPGNDTITGGDGPDAIVGDRGNDVLNGKGGYDVLTYQSTFFREDAFQGIDLDVVARTVTDPWGGLDTISNFEVYVGSRFADVMRGSGKDEEFAGLKGADLIDGRGGTDTVSYVFDIDLGARHGIQANLATGQIVDGWGKVDTVLNVENVDGTGFDDTFVGDGDYNVFRGLAGVDSFDGGGDDDRLLFDNIAFFGATSGVKIDFTRNDEIIDDGFGNRENADNIQDVQASPFKDVVKGDDLNNDFDGFEGNDVLVGRGGRDALYGGEGKDTLDGGDGIDDLSGGAGRDTLTGGADGDEFIFSEMGEANFDTITDFDRSEGDLITLDSEIFVGLDDPIPGSAFAAGPGLTAATTASQRLVYDTTSGKLYFDEDGVNGNPAVLFAVLNGAPALTAADFQMMS